MTNTYKLIVQSGTGMGTEFPLEKVELFLGRDVTSDLVINDPEVSRRHLRLVMDGATYRIEDLGSTNGTFIHGQRLSGPILLKPGEVITLGEKIVLRFEATSTDPNATVVVQRNAAPPVPQQQKPVFPPPAAVQPPMATPVVPAPVAQAPVYSAPPVQAAPSISAMPAYQQPRGQVPPPAALPKKKASALVIILILVGVLLLFCVVPWIIIDLTNSYCSLFPGILNMLITNACPV
jgi:hypothetical protein